MDETRQIKLFEYINKKNYLNFELLLMIRFLNTNKK